MKIGISPINIQKQVLSPSMQQSIEILMLPLIELTTAIEQELQTNPLLETSEDSPSLDDLHLDSLPQRFKEIEENLSRTREHFNSDDEEVEEKQIAQDTNLEQHLLQQLRVELNDPTEITIGEFIIGNLNEEGYLELTCEEIAQALNISDLPLIECVLYKIQAFDPHGVASRDLKECLVNQVQTRFNGESTLVKTVILNHLEEIGRKKFNHIARELGISPAKVKEAAQMIAKLEPKPARNYHPIESNIYVKADVIVKKDNIQDRLHIQINNEYIPQLRINSSYKNLLKKGSLSAEEKEFIREKMRGALYFIKSIEQRNSTLREIAEYIVNHQKDFFEHGHMALKPMVLKDVAQAINRNESTVSRAVNHKYMDTPQGFLPMKFFFAQSVNPQSINEHAAQDVSSRSIKEEIKSLIESEKKSQPLSDQDIQLYFQGKGLRVARRTVNKYRKSLQILPSYLRRDN